jgi:hypothetical protein
VLDRLQANGKHLLGLINDVLDLSKIEAGQLTLDLDDYSLKDVVDTVGPIARGHVSGLFGGPQWAEPPSAGTRASCREGPLNARCGPGHGGEAGIGGRDLLSGVGTLKSAPSIRPQPRRANYTLVQTTVRRRTERLVSAITAGA